MQKKEFGDGAGVGLCPFSWNQETHMGWMSGQKLVLEPEPCLEARCKLWDADALPVANCGLVTKNQAPAA